MGSFFSLGLSWPKEEFEGMKQQLALTMLFVLGINLGAGDLSENTLKYCMLNSNLCQILRSKR